MFDKIGITQAPFLNVDIFLPTITKFECRFTSAILSNNIVSFFIKKSYVLINHKSFSQKKKKITNLIMFMCNIIIYILINKIQVN